MRMKIFLIGLMLVLCQVQFARAEIDQDRSELNRAVETSAEARRQSLIEQYERELDLFDLDNFENRKDWKTLMKTARKLGKLDPQNPTAFRATVLYYRNNDKTLKRAEDYCRQAIDSNESRLLSIEAFIQLGDMHFDDKATALKYVDRAIELVKEQYAPSEIEELVNGSNVELSNLHLVGRSNSIRELYILKSDLEGFIPTFEAKSVIEELVMIEDRVYNVKYRTDW